jgi:hypothetical protein
LPDAEVPPIVAMTLAQEAAVAFGSDERDREQLVQAALGVGQWLADQGCPGRWDALDPAAVLELMSLSTEVETSAFLLALAGLVGHAAFHEQLAFADARRIMLEIKSLARDPAISAFAGKAAEQLRPL